MLFCTGVKLGLSH